MHRFVWHLAILCLFPAIAFGQPQPAAGPAPPLDVPSLVAKTEPTVACILVSRSPLYRKFNMVTGQEPPGVLGDVRGLDFLPGADTERSEIRRQLRLDDPHHVPEAFGTGLIIDPKGLVLTNYHVIRDAVKVFVRWPDGQGSYADIHAADPRSDLAVLKLLTPGNRPLPTIRFGNADNIRRGETVVALSNPYVAGFLDGHASVSVGKIVSNLRAAGSRAVSLSPRAAPITLYQFGLLMQTDARLALGSSGGGSPRRERGLHRRHDARSPTPSSGGDVPGGFAAPVTTRMRKIINTLHRGEEVDYGFLGVGLRPDSHRPPGPRGFRADQLSRETRRDRRKGRHQRRRRHSDPRQPGSLPRGAPARARPATRPRSRCAARTQPVARVKATLRQVRQQRTRADRDVARQTALRRRLARRLHERDLQPGTAKDEGRRPHRRRQEGEQGLQTQALRRRHHHAGQRSQRQHAR